MLKDLESADLAEVVPTTLVSNSTSASGMPLLVCSSTRHNTDPFPPDAAPAPPSPSYNDQVYLGTSNKLDFNAHYFVGSSATDFLMGTTDTEMNFDWVSSTPSKVFKWPVLVLIVEQELWDSQFLQAAPMADEDFDSLTFQ